MLASWAASLAATLASEHAKQVEFGSSVWHPHLHLLSLMFISTTHIHLSVYILMPIVWVGCWLRLNVEYRIKMVGEGRRGNGPSAWGRCRSEPQLPS